MGEGEFESKTEEEDRREDPEEADIESERREREWQLSQPADELLCATERSKNALPDASVDGWHGPAQCGAR